MMGLTPTLLLILDGYGLAAPGPGNAAALAHTPTLDRLLAQPGLCKLAASGREVGLPAGFIGNSEVGHLNLGAGRIVYQDMTRIDVDLESGDFFQNPALLQLCQSIKASGGRLHLLGLLSDGGVHSHTNHLSALLDLARQQDVPALLHAFMDGRDTSPTSGAHYIEALQPSLDARCRLASLCGRFYAMDRDKRWERVHEAWNLLVHGKGELTPDPIAALHAAYESGETDEFLKPRLVLPPAEACIRDGDGVFFFNFRADRARELAHAFLDPMFTDFDRGTVPALASFATMTAYDTALAAPVAFSKDNLAMTLGEVISSMGLKQLRIAETEKYAHVTYFFSGGREDPFPGEDRIMVPSPKEVATYDLKPQMSAEEVTDKLLHAWATGQYTFAVCNLANPDMVGHTGVINAAIKACETVDACVERIEAAILASGGRLCITADHGNVEVMLTPDGSPQTAHTTNPTPFLIVEPNKSVSLSPSGKLGDVATTLLALWGIPQPAEMSGVAL